MLTAHGQSPSRQSWPPPLQKVSSDSPPLSPAEALKTFYLPPGYSIELVASEPLIQDPVAIDWDPAGRLWAVEMSGYMRNISGGNEHDPVGRVIVLQDENGDGRMDKRTVFADGLVLARAVKVLDRGVLVGEPPNAWLMRDTNGDLRMDTKELVTNQYGRLDADPQNNANEFFWALDNWMHVTAQDIGLRLENGAFEVRRTLRRGQWGATQDDAGRIYRNTNESALHVDLVPTAYFARNPNLLRTRGSYERLADDNPDLNVVWPVRPTPATNRAYQFGILRADGSLARFTAVCAPAVYRGDRLPADLYGNVFVVEPAANLVSRIVLNDDGTTLRARKAYERGEFLASTDERFRPVYLSSAPDGTLYVVDMYRGILEHRLSMTEHLRDQILARKLEQPIGMGRIYRVVHETTRRDTSLALSEASPAELVAALAHPNGWWRDTAQRLLVERRPASAIPALAKLAQGAADWRARLHALWALDGIDALEPAMVTRALDDKSRDVRAAAIRLAERWLGEAKHPLRGAVLKLLHDADWSVRRQLAASLGVLPASERDAAIASLLDAHAGDPVTLDAALSGLRGREAAVLQRFMRAGNAPTPERQTAITMLAATIVRSAQEGAIQDLFGWFADGSRAEWQRSALLAGLEVALLGAAMPGATPPRVAAPAATGPLPCPTCPGGRGGPGGAYAYQRPDAPPRDPAARGGGRSGERLQLNREPVALTRFNSRDQLAARVSAVLARVSWPGKPGDGAPLPPLTAEEQRRFDAGREIYRNVCQACHLADGRGQDRIAPTLIGAAFTLGPPEIPTRILLNGKEGAVGLMPPIGSMLTDEQVASVLTYVRREWGQASSAVDADTVKRVRALSIDRRKPWTDDELIKLLTVAQRQPAPTFDIYVIDVEGGEATLFVSPTKESLLVDTGWPGFDGRDADRILAAAKHAGITRIDHLVVTHYHGDHVGGTAQLAARLPIRRFVDRGANATEDERAQYQVYSLVRDAARAAEVKPGDAIPMDGLNVRVIAAGGSVLRTPLPGHGSANPFCAGFKPHGAEITSRAADGGDSRSVSLFLAFGKFRTVIMGDLTWNKEFELMCPANPLGDVDLYLVSHHGSDTSGSAALVHALRPRAAIMNNGPRKGGAIQTFQILRESPGVPDLWQNHYSIPGGQQHNRPEPFIANLDEGSPVAGAPPGAAPVHTGPAHWIKVSARADGGFTISNSRTGSTKEYPPRQ